MNSKDFIIQKILDGENVRKILFENEIISTEFIGAAEKFKRQLCSKYKFVKSVDLEISDETKYISNFFITVYTKLSGIFPEESVAEYNLEKVVSGTNIVYGIGGLEEFEISEGDLAKSISDLFYLDAGSCGLEPVSTKNSYALMKYSNETKFYNWKRDSSYNLILKLEFYTDRGLRDK